MEYLSFPPQLIAVMAAIVVFGVVVVVFGSKPQKDQAAASQRLFKKMYEFFSTNFLTQGRVLKITERLASLSIYNRGELQVLATKQFLITTSISLGIIIASIFLFADTVSIIICVTFAVVINTVLIDKQVDKINKKVYTAMRGSISSIRQCYLQLNSVPESIALADIDPLLKKCFDEIYQILTSAEGDLLLLKFYESTPFRSMQTLATICYNVDNSGDEVDAYGQSVFINALTMLSTDVNAELTKLNYMKTKFGVIEYLTLAPIFCMTFIENYFIDTMPGTALIYNGMIGYICRVVTLALCAACYKIVATINSSESVKDDDRTPWSKWLLTKPKFRQFVYDIEPKDKKRRILERKLDKALSKKGPEHMTCERVVISAICLIFGVICLVTIVDMAHDYYANTTDQLSLVADESMDKYSHEEILEMDNQYIDKYCDGGEYTDEEKQSFIKSFMPSLSDLQVQDQQSRIENKYENLQAAYLHWYYLFIIYALALLGWFMPDILLAFRTTIVKTEAEDDFMQLQTLMAIIMNLGIDTLEAIWQLCQNSKIHKYMLLYCYHSYPSNPEVEIARLKNKTPIKDFQRFLGKLDLTISELSLADAYSDLSIERDFMIRMREQSTYATINKKRQLCGPIAMAPFIMMVIGEFLIPIGVLGINEFTKALSSMG